MLFPPKKPPQNNLVRGIERMKREKGRRKTKCLNHSFVFSNKNWLSLPQKKLKPGGPIFLLLQRKIHRIFKNGKEKKKSRRKDVSSFAYPLEKLFHPLFQNIFFFFKKICPVPLINIVSTVANSLEWFLRLKYRKYPGSSTTWPMRDHVFLE